MSEAIGVRWTVGDASARGYEALRLSIWGVYNLFGPGAAYVVSVNQIAPEARRRTGEAPAAVSWRPPGQLPDFLCGSLDPGMAEGVAWKFAPLRLFPERYEVALDNDCILWAMPPSVLAWLESDRADQSLLAEDVRQGFGHFAALCPPEPRNSGFAGCRRGSTWARHAQRAGRAAGSPDVGTGRAGAPGGRPVTPVHPPRGPPR